MAKNASSKWPRNRLLLALPSRNLKRLMPELEQIRCQRAQILMDADSSLDHVFFPIAVLSRWWQFMRTAISLRWQRSEGRAAAACKRSWVPSMCQSCVEIDKQAELLWHAADEYCRSIVQ